MSPPLEPLHPQAQYLTKITIPYLPLTTTQRSQMRTTGGVVKVPQVLLPALETVGTAALEAPVMVATVALVAPATVETVETVAMGVETVPVTATELAPEMVTETEVAPEGT